MPLAQNILYNKLTLHQHSTTYIDCCENFQKGFKIITFQPFTFQLCNYSERILQYVI